MGNADRWMPQLSRTVWLVLFGQLVSAAGSGATVPFLFVYLHQARGLGAAVVGSLLTVRAVGALIGALIGGAWVDRVGPKRAVLWALTAGAVTTGAIATVHSPIPGIMILGAYGVVMAAATAAMNTLLGTVASPEERPQAFGIQFMFVNVGGAGGAAVAAVVLATWSMAAVYPVLYFLDATSFVVLAVLIARSVVLPMHEVAAEANPQEPSSQVTGYRAIASDPAFRWLAIITLLLVAAGFCQLHVGIPGYAAMVGLPAAGLGWVFFANLIAVVVLQIPLQRLSALWRRTTSLTVGISVIGCAWALVQTLGQMSILVLVAAGVMFACAEVLLSPILSTLVNDIATPALRGRYNGALVLSWTSGWLGGTVLTAALLGAGHSNALFATLIVVLALAALAVIPLRRHLPRSLNHVTGAMAATTDRGRPQSVEEATT